MTTSSAGTPFSCVILSRGQAHEALGEFSAALSCYDEAIALLNVLPLGDEETQRQLGVAWMNRGNALQKQKDSIAAVGAYDEAIGFFSRLTPSSAIRNHLGSAWLNRGHAFLHRDSAASESDATRSFEQAIAFLRDLPLDEKPAYRLNLAGAWTNLAHVQSTAFPSRARISAVTALDLVDALAADHLAFAEMTLRAQRVRVIALGEILRMTEAARRPIDLWAAEATDSIDAGLDLARVYERRGITNLRLLAVRLFRLGAQLYRIHQPHFLAEFLFENLEPSDDSFAGFGRDPEFLAVAEHALAAGLEELSRPRLLFVDAPDSQRLLQIVNDLRAAQRRLAEISK